MNSLELKDARAQFKKRALEIITNCKNEVRDLTDEEQTELEEIRSKIAEKDVELRQLEERVQALHFDASEEEETRTATQENNITSNIRKNTMEKRFSLIRAIRSIANNQPLDDVSLAVINAGKEEARKSGISAQGQICLPSVENRAAITVTNEGEDIVATELFDIVTPLRAKNVLAQAGAKVLTGLVGNVQYPIMGKTNVAWEGETDTASDGGNEFTHKTLSPKRLTAYVDISRQVLAQDSIGVEQAIRNDIIAAVNSKLEETILSDDAATTTKPGGIFAEITPETITDFAGLVDLEADVDDANVLGEKVYVMSNKAKAAFRAMAKSTKSTQLVYENGEMDGTKAFNTSNVEGKNFVFGDFSNLVIGSWATDITVDPFTVAKDGCVRLVVNAYLDAAILRNEAFVTGTIGA